MASECVRLDDNLKDLGLMQIPYTATYIYQNTYTSPDTELNDYSASRDIVFNDMQKKLNSVTQYIGLAYYATNQFTFRYNTNDAANLFNNFSKLNRSNPDLTEVINKINSVLKEIINSNQNKDNIFSNDIAELSNCKSYLEKASKFLKSNDSNCQKTISDIVYTIQAKFIPLLTKLNFRNASITDIIEKLIAQNELICYTIAETFPKLQPFTTKIQPFIKLLAKGYDFDKASTYSEYFKLISDLEIVFEDGEIKEVLSKINSFVKDYTSVGKDENGKEYIDFKVESFLTNLQQIKYDKQGVFPVSFLFTVGVNSGIFGSPVYLKNDTINNLSFVSEKIGLKIKLIDNKFWKTRNPGEVYKRNFNSTYTKISPPKEPIISDWHLLLYGSGILYNIAKLKTNSTFNSPLIGFGMGITCYNSLDVNLSIAYPLLPESKHLSNPLYNLGFDIRFGEYLDRLNKRKSQKNIQNILAKTTAK